MPLISLKSSKLSLEKEEKVMKEEKDCTLYLEATKTEGKGTLYITSKNVIWISSDKSDFGYSFDYPFLSLHAISRDSESFKSPCIYCQFDIGEDEEKVSEARFVPSDDKHLDELFEAFSKAAEMNPDPVKEGDNEEGGDEFIYAPTVNEDDESEYADADEDDSKSNSTTTTTTTTTTSSSASTNSSSSSSSLTSSTSSSTTSSAMDTSTSASVSSSSSVKST
eukprot:TRINITY_DN76_c7_g1_i1.p1 TRINITY_DN76_c7_g1~~TRINITY_DN76_c7_g1_i1.p1  ORF type:complete len:222 (+),score=92.56 TRINITY_DN76_c7_g1_i1:77-742(+)